MKIEEGKFYKTRDGRKVGPAFVNDFGTSVFGSKENYESAVWTDTGRAGLRRSVEQKANDIVAEWQDEPKKEISDMSEVKFKVGDYVEDISSAFPPENRGFVAAIDGNQVRICWDGHGQSMEEAAEENCLWPNDEFKLVKSASIPEPNTKWVFNDGQDFVVRVVGLDNSGSIVLEALNEDSVFYEKKFFTFENEPEKFGEFYKPWVEKVEEPKSLVGYVTVVKNVGTGHIDFDASVFDTEQEARDGFDSWSGAWELVDVVKVEWEES